MTQQIIYWTGAWFAALGGLNAIMILCAIVVLWGPTGSQVRSASKVLLVSTYVVLMLWAAALNVLVR